MSNFSIPSQPLFTRSIIGKGGQSPPTLLRDTTPWLYTSARYAQYALMRAMQLSASDEVLLPSYHCPAMVTPVLARGAKPRYYALQSDLSATLADVERSITPRTRLIVATHFFGWLQDFQPLRALCDARNIVLLEDCSHALFGQRDGRTVGHTGHYAMTSLIKWLPMVDGGALVAHGLHTHRFKDTRPPSRGFAFRAGVDVFERARHFGHWPMLAPLFAAKDLVQTMRRRAPPPASMDPSPDLHQKDTVTAVSVATQSSGSCAAHDGGSAFQSEWADLAPSWPSLRVMRAVSLNRIAARRRQVHESLASALTRLPGVQTIMPALQPSWVPFALPLLVDDVDRRVARLRAAKLPFMRWDALHPSIDLAQYPLAKHYARSLLHIPCHEAYGSAEVALWQRALA